MCELTYQGPSQPPDGRADGEEGGEEEFDSPTNEVSGPCLKD